MTWCLWACMCCLGLVSAFASDAPAAVPPVSALTVARAALEDGLCELAQGQLETYLDGLKQGHGGGDKDRTEAAELLLRALHKQGKNEEVLTFVASMGSRWTKQGRLDIPTFWCALANYDLGQYDKALVLTDEFRNSKFPGEYADRIRQIRAWSLLGKGDTDGALAEFAGFAADFPGSDYAGDNLLDWGKALLSLGQAEAARAVLKQAVAMTNSAVVMREGLYWTAKGLMLEEKWDEAIVNWRRVVSKYPDTDAASLAQFSIADTFERKLGNVLKRLDRDFAGFACGIVLRKNQPLGLALG